MSTVMQSPFILTLTFLYLFFGNVSFGQPNVYHQANYKHKPIVEMTINNTKTWVLLDTGSDITILDIKSKKKLGFSTLANAGRTVPGLGSSNNRLYRAKNVTLNFGDIPRIVTFCPSPPLLTKEIPGSRETDSAALTSGMS